MDILFELYGNELRIYLFRGGDGRVPHEFIQLVDVHSVLDRQNCDCVVCKIKR